MTKQVTDADFATEVINNDKLAVVDFWAEWCGPCKMLGPTIEQLATEYDGQANIVKLNIDENPNASTEFGVRSIPTVLFFKGGKVVDKVVGLVPKAKLDAMIKQHLS
jgi:thioredoxin 1